MRLVRGATAVLLGTCVPLGLLPTPALAGPAPALQQTAGGCLPGVRADYPPAPPVVDLEASLELDGGTLRPEVDSSLALHGAQPGADYCAILFSVPITIPPTRAGDDGALGLRPAVPLGFELAASHHLDVYRAERLVGSFDFCVDRRGTVVVEQATACGTVGDGGGRSLVRTGLDHLLDLLRLGAALLAVGAFARYVRRGRPAGRTPTGRSARGRPRG